MTGPSLPALPCACASLRRAARAVTQLYDAALRDTGLRATQFTLLQVLQRRGESMQGELGDFLALDSTTLSRTLQPLAARRWIKSRSGDDRRAALWSITAEGRRRLERATPAWEAAQQRLRDRIGGDPWLSLLEDLAGVAALARSTSA